MTYLGDEAVQSQLVLRQTLVQGAQLGQGVPQRGLLCPQLGHGELECHTAGLCLQGWDQQPDSQAERRGRDAKDMEMRKDEEKGREMGGGMEGETRPSGRVGT